MTLPIHTVKHVKSAYRRHQIITIVFTLITISAALAVALSGMQLASLRKQQADAQAVQRETPPPQKTSTPDKTLAKAVEQLKAEIAEEKKKSGALKASITKLQQQLSTAKAALSDLQSTVPQTPQSAPAIPVPPQPQTEKQQPSQPEPVGTEPVPQAPSASEPEPSTSNTAPPDSTTPAASPSPAVDAPEPLPAVKAPSPANSGSAEQSTANTTDATAAPLPPVSTEKPTSEQTAADEAQLSEETIQPGSDQQ